MVEQLRCPKCQGGIWNDQFSEKRGDKYRFVCARCHFVVTIAGCKECRHPWMELVHGVEKGGPHRPYFRFQCPGCGRVVGVQIDVWAQEGT